MNCKKCGSEIEQGARFCGVCGFDVEPEMRSERRSRTCRRCGAELEGGAPFCGKCGFSTEAYANEIQIRRQPSKKKEGGRVIAFVVAVLLSAAVGGVAAVVVTNIKSKSDSDDNLITTASEPTISYKDEAQSDLNEMYKDYDQDDDYDQNDEYLFPSDTRLITNDDLKNLSKEDVALIRNEIYARHGYIFKTKSYREYFEKKSWYTPNPNFSESMFNKIEKENTQFLVAYEKNKGWR